MDDAFARCHPAVCFLFFTGAIVFTMFFTHPAYLAVSLCSAALYFLILRGSLKTIAALLPIFLLLSAINPIFNTSGKTVLFTLMGRAYTLEALKYGMAIAAMFDAMLLWFACYNLVMTGDRLISLFGSLIPSLSLLLVMVFRLVPEYRRRLKRIGSARRCIGRGADGQAALMGKVRDGAVILSALGSWALEGSMTTADSMQSRGYATGTRTAFRVMRFGRADTLLCAYMAALQLITLFAAMNGFMNANYTPELAIAPVNDPTSIVCLAAYILFLLIPSIIDLKEAVQWRISTYRL